MFERYTEGARRALFFARAAVTEHGGTSIGATHLMLGLLRELPPALAARPGGGGSAQRLSECLVAHIASHELLAESVEIPFDPVARRALQRSGRRPQNRQAPDGQDIDVEDVLLALLRERPADAVTCLRDAGIDAGVLERDLAAARGW